MTYNLPKKLAQSWIENNELLLLLDGLDEVSIEYRSVCVRAINDFTQEYPRQIVISSRIQEYRALDIKLQLVGAVKIQPLGAEQVELFFKKVGGVPEFIAELRQQDELPNLLVTPLFLGILVMALDESRQNSSEHDRFGAPQLLDAYIQRMLSHRSSSNTFRNIDTIRWLKALAMSMLEQQESVFVMTDGIGGWIYRLISWGKGKSPFDMKQFLEYAAEKLFLRRVDDGYIFIHRVFMEHFANLSNENIVRITTSVED